MSKGFIFCDRIMALGVGPGPFCIMGYGARSAGPDMDIRPLWLDFLTVEGMGIPEPTPRKFPYGSAAGCIVDRRRKSAIAS
jgi:hypothetical protein